MNNNLKKILVLLLAVLLLLAGCGKKTPAPDPTPDNTHAAAPQQDAGEKALSELQEAIRADGSICGIAFLGCHGGVQAMFDDFSENGILELFPFIEDLPAERMVSAAGGEVYLLIPAEEGMEITVEEAFLEANGADITFKELYSSSDAEPLLLQGNESEVFANLAITLKGDGETLGYSPFMSLMDGKLATAYPPTPSITDLTPYDIVLPGVDPNVDNSWFGTWYGIGYDDYGTQLLMSLTFLQDGSAYYSYGEPYSEIVEVFEGTWTEENGILSLNMWGGLVNAMDEGAKYSFIGQFSRLMMDDWMLLTHEGGNALLYGTDGCQFMFVDFDPSYAEGSWYTSEVLADGAEVYHELYLAWDGVSSYCISDTTGGYREVYGGQWGIDGNGILWLDLYQEGGTDQISGGYYYGFDNGNMDLSYAWGDYLTYFMQDNGWDTLYSSYGVG